jgi:hypothetical protein
VKGLQILQDTGVLKAKSDGGGGWHGRSVTNRPSCLKFLSSLAHFSKLQQDHEDLQKEHFLHNPLLRTDGDTGDFQSSACF